MTTIFQVVHEAGTDLCLCPSMLFEMIEFRFARHNKIVNVLGTGASRELAVIFATKLLMIGESFAEYFIAPNGELQVVARQQLV